MSIDSDDAPPQKQRLLTVANRLPVTIKKKDGEYSYSQSSGGLVTGLSGLPDTYDKLWIGWPGTDVPEEDVERVEQDILEQYGGVPLWINHELMDMHYNGFCNGILWPLFHYHANEMVFEEEPWEAFVQVNKLFSEMITPHVKDNDIVWVHDYHLMLLPKMLREEVDKRGLKQVKIGFFLHTPFPSSYEFCKLPYREMVLEGLLHSTLIGFHTYDYARHFLSACHRALGLTSSPNGVQYRRRTVHVGAFPIGINPSKELGLLQEPAVRDRIDHWRNGLYKNKSVIISVDRLDYIKGLPHKFHAFDMFLEHNPDQVGKVVLIQIAVPSRQDVKEYQILRSHVSELAGRINSKYGDIDYQPIVFQYRSVPPTELIALYAMSDICLVTSTRDGMNLVAYEYIVCQKERKGQLVLSEFAGAAQSMKGCIVINPWDTQEIMDGIRKALDMDEERRRENWTSMNRYVNKFTSSWWGQTFVEEIRQLGEQLDQEGILLRKPSQSEHSPVLKSMGQEAESVKSGGSEKSPVQGPQTGVASEVKTPIVLNGVPETK